MTARAISPDEHREQEARRLARETPLSLAQARALVAEHGSAEAAARWAGHALATGVAAGIRQAMAIEPTREPANVTLGGAGIALTQPCPIDDGWSYAILRGRMHEESARILARSLLPTHGKRPAIFALVAGKRVESVLVKDIEQGWCSAPGFVDVRVEIVPASPPPMMPLPKPDPRAERERRRREIDALLREDARRHPAFATARRCAVLAAHEPGEGCPGVAPDALSTLLADLRRHEEQRGIGREPVRGGPMAEEWMRAGAGGIWTVAVAHYERARRLP